MWRHLDWKVGPQALLGLVAGGGLGGPRGLMIRDISTATSCPRFAGPASQRWVEPPLCGPTTYHPSSRLIPAAGPLPGMLAVGSPGARLGGWVQVEAASRRRVLIIRDLFCRRRACLCAGFPPHLPLTPLAWHPCQGWVSWRPTTSIPSGGRAAWVRGGLMGGNWWVLSPHRGGLYRRRMRSRA